MKKLLAYKLNGKVINVEIFNWSISDLNGNRPWIISDEIIEGYKDISSITNWSNLASKLDVDFIFIRDRIREILNSSFTDKENNIANYIDRIGDVEEKICSDYFLVGKVTRDKYYTESEQYKLWQNFLTRSYESRKIRWERAKIYISYKLSNQNSSDLAISTYELCSNYISYNIIAKSKDGVSGLFDYLRGIEDFSLNGYPSKIYWTQQDQDKLLDILENGNY